MAAGPWVFFNDCFGLRDTEKAVLVHIDGVHKAREGVWIPKSQIHDDSEVYAGGTEGTLVCAEWVAKQNGLPEGEPYEAR